MPSYRSVGVIGAGAWGTALAGVAARAGRAVVLYARNAESAAQMQSTRANPRLPGVRLDERIERLQRTPLGHFQLFLKGLNGDALIVSRRHVAGVRKMMQGL